MIDAHRFPVAGPVFGVRKKRVADVPECDVCGDHLAECQSGECSQYQLYVAGGRSLPPGPRLPSRGRKPLSRPTSAGGELVFSNGKGMSIQADPDTNEIDTGWQDLPVCGHDDTAEPAGTLPTDPGTVGGTG